MAKIKIKAELKMKALQHQDNEIHICPNCGSKRTNQVSLNTYFCLECDIEFNPKTNKKYSILYSWELVDYFVNEFVEIN